MKLHSYLLLAILTALIGCGGGGGGGGGGLTGGGSGGSGGSITDAERLGAITAVENQIHTLLTKGLTQAQVNSQILDYLKTRGEFTDAGLSPDSSVWARFKDDRYLVVVNNRDPLPPGAGTLSGGPVAAGANDKITTSKQARLLHSFGTGFDQQQNPINRMSSMLRDGGYTIAGGTEGDARLSTLRTISGDGFLYFNTHGGSYTFQGGDKVFSAGSSTKVDQFTEKQPEIMADFAANRIAYMTAANGEFFEFLGKEIPKFDTRYSINHRFVSQYWSFGSNALVFMNACYSGITTTQNGAQRFYEAIFAKGCGAYLGWDDKVATPTSEKAPLFLVDRLSAANSEQPEDPKQRPFFVTAVVDDMHAKGIVPGANGANIVLKFSAGGVSDVGLRPTIEYVAMNEISDILFLIGSFGSELGEVIVDGAPAQIISWGADQISARIPIKGKGSGGEVVVKVHQKESNKRFLSKYSSTFEMHQRDSGNLQVLINATIVVRQDMGKRRNKISGKLEYPDPYISLFGSPESVVTYVASGSHSGTSYSGSGTLVWSKEVPDNMNPDGRYMVTGTYDTASGQLVLGIIANGRVTIKTETETHYVHAGSASMVSSFNPNTWTIQPYSMGDEQYGYSFSQMIAAPKPDNEYHY